MTPTRHHAVVIGASIAGLLAARVLAERFERVTLIDRDTLPDGPAHRRHVPQAHHYHALLASGRAALAELLPGIDTALVERGARSGDAGHSARWVLAGQRHCARDTGIRGVAASRILIESAVRERVRALPNVELDTGTEVLGVRTATDHGRITGLRVRDARGERLVESDLLVDCAGRGSRTPAWLQALGLAPPPVEELRIDARYRSRHFRVPASAMGALTTLIVGPVPGNPRYGVIGYQETGLHLCALGGLGGEQAPDDLDGYLAFARRLAAPDLYEVLCQSEAVDEAHSFGLPSNLRRRYERLRRFPDGWLVMGDALCSFNPTYGQGMSVAALEALRLREWLQRPRARPRDWFRAAAEIIDRPWAIVCGGDAWTLGLPQARRGFAGAINRYLMRLHAAASGDAAVADAFLRVANLQAPAPSLLRPSIAWRVYRAAARSASATPANLDTQPV